MSARKNRTKHIDASVVYTFVGVFLIAAVTLAFRYTNIVPCDVAEFSFKAGDGSNELTAGDLIKFYDESEGAISWSWDFGDSLTASRKNPTHNFKEPGEYQVQLVVNNHCMRTETIVVKEKAILRDPTRFPVFTLPESIVVGETLIVEDKTANAKSWEWRFGETENTVDGDTQVATFVYTEPGIKTVRLIVNGDTDYIGKKDIKVTPKLEVYNPLKDITVEEVSEFDLIPDDPDIDKVEEAEVVVEKKKIYARISQSQFEERVYDITQKLVKMEDFVKYFCGDLNTKVIVNGRETTFDQFFNKIKDLKIKKRSLSCVLDRDMNSICIKSIKIDYDKKFLSRG